MIEKPDWKDAPEWANWLAQDADGSWTWFLCEPEKDGGEWCDRGCRWERATTHRPIGPKEPRPKPKVRTITLPRGHYMELHLSGACELQRAFGPCTITITEDNA